MKRYRTVEELLMTQAPYGAEDVWPSLAPSVRAFVAGKLHWRAWRRAQPAVLCPGAVVASHEARGVLTVRLGDRAERREIGGAR